MEVAAGWIKYGLFSLLFLISVGDVRGTLVLLGRNVSIAFDDMEASFAPSVKSSGECGVFYLADPLDACSPLNNKNVYSSNSSFALIIRGGCAFDKKVMAAQEAGFKAAIIYDNEENGDLVPMSGDPHGIRICAVFITKASGETLKKFAGVSGLELWILPSFDNSTWSILAISFISLLAMLAVLATCFFVRRHRVHRERPRAPLAPEFHGMSSQLVKAMPSLIFTTVQGDNCTSMTCAICLEDYSPGDKIRILPCLHKFHAICVDMWLTSWRTFCPVCKQDARSNTKIPPASECTPLLSGAPASPDITTVLSSHQSIAASPAIPIMSSPPHSQSSRNHSLSSTPHVLNQLMSFSNSPTINIISRSNGSSVDHRNLLFHQSYAPYSLASSVPSRFASPRFHSSGYASPSYLTCPRITSPHINRSGYGSPSYLAG